MARGRRGGTYASSFAGHVTVSNVRRVPCFCSPSDHAFAVFMKAFELAYVIVSTKEGLNNLHSF